MTASALPLDEEEAVLTHDLELVVDPHADDNDKSNGSVPVIRLSD